MAQSKSTQFGYLSLFFTTILLILILGFYQTYLMFFPKFQGFRLEQHFHGIMMLVWMTFLIIQPLLIKAKLFKVHRFIGKLSLIAAPLMILSIFMVSKMVYHRSIATLTLEESLASTVLGITNMFAFILFYYLAIFNSRNMAIHMRYMIGTALLMLGPGLGRLLGIRFKLQGDLPVDIFYILVIVITLILLVYDIRKKKNYRPYLVVLIILVFLDVLWKFRLHEIWQVPAKAFADLLF
jgi:hypothetical protein